MTHAPYHEETCASCSTQLVPGDPRTRDALGVYCTRMACIARNQTVTFENRALAFALATARFILRNASRATKSEAA